MPRRSHPSPRPLPDSPDLVQLKRQAKELLKAFATGDAAAAATVAAHYHQAPGESFALHHAQLVVARSYGFDSWPKLKAYVDGVTIARLIEAVRANDVSAVRSMLTRRPELVRLDVSEHDEHRALHYAVLQRQPEMVGLLMDHGADARQGIWPHRDATTPLTLATDRGYTDIVDILLASEARRSGTAVPILDAPITATMLDAFRRGDEATLIRLLEANPAFIRLADPSSRMTALHAAAACLLERLATWLLDHGADAQARTRAGRTPLDALGAECDARSPANQQRLRSIGQLLLRRGAERTARWAVATGDAEWLRARHAAGGLPHDARLVSQAVGCDQPEMLGLLLQLGLDPDERERVEGLEEVVYSWGNPLRRCARAGDAAMAALLLQHGADPHTHVYAASSAMHDALAGGHSAVVQVLEQYGGIVEATAAAYLGLADRIRQFFDDERLGRLPKGAVPPGADLAYSVLEAAADGAHVDLVRLALDHLDWPPGDARWQGMLMRPFGRHDDMDRPRYVECFRLMLDRSGIALPWTLGRTLLHDVAADWPRNTMSADDRLAFAAILIERGSPLDARDDLLKSTPLGWACRWGRTELVRLLLASGADPVEADAEPWATPQAWAEKMNHPPLLAMLRQRM